MSSQNDRWTIEDFPRMVWHDARVHAIVPPDDEMNLVLLIDYILEWRKKSDDEPFNFRVAPAVLKFLDVLDLKIELTFGRIPTLSIDEIQMVGRSARDADYSSFRIIFDQGEVSFSARDFRQRLVGEPVVSTRQDTSYWDTVIAEI